MIRKTFGYWERLTAAALLVLVSACATGRPRPTPQPTPTATPAPAVAILTVEVSPKQAIVTVGDRDWGTREDGTIVEEFRAGDVHQVSARAPGFKPSDPVSVTMTAGRMPVIRIVLDELQPPAPTPPPVPPVFTIVDGKIPPAVFNTIRQFAATFPLPRGDTSEEWADRALRFGWTKRLAEQLAWNYGPAWGQKRRGPGSPVSSGSIAMKAAGGMDVWDLLIGAATGAPVLSSGPEHFWVTDQEFLPVARVDHLGNVVFPTDRPPIATPFRGVSSFDLAPRVHAGDMRWIDEVLVPYKLVGRMFMYVNCSSGPRLCRNADLGLIQTESLLKVFVQRGLKGQFVILVGTGSCCDNWSREQALDYVRRANALFVRYPSAVAGLQIGNENSHSIEAPYMTDAGFLAEADALIDKRFPLAWGAGHGGEGVSMAGGSYLVHHGDRGLTPEENGVIMGQAQRDGRRPVIDDEALGITEVGRTAGRQRTDDPQYARRQLDAVRTNSLGGLTLHIDAGLTCNVDELGPVQRAALAFFAGTQEEQEELRQAA